MSRSLRSSTRSSSSPVKTEETSPVPETPGRKLRRKRRNEDDSDKESSSESEVEITSGRTVQGRPFEIIGNLPSSIDEPDYNSALTHPLSVKDSAILYNSLIQSRKTWLQGEMFETCWIRPQRDPNDPHASNNSGVRDKMQKMCDCVLKAGPHEFTVRLFILKDDEIERKWQEEQENIKKSKVDRKLEAIEQKRRRMEEREKTRELKKQQKEQRSQEIKEARMRAKLESDILKQKRKDESKRMKEEKKSLKKKEKTLKQKISSTPLSQGSNSDSTLNSDTSGNIKNNPSQNNQESNTPEAQDPSKDKKMIANLNHMARKDKSLSSLMERVARSTATLDEVESFKKIIQLARKMPAPPGFVPTTSTVPIVRLNQTKSIKTYESEKNGITKEGVESNIEEVAKVTKYEDSTEKNPSTTTPIETVPSTAKEKDKNDIEQHREAASDEDEDDDDKTQNSDDDEDNEEEDDDEEDDNEEENNEEENKEDVKKEDIEKGLPKKEGEKSTTKLLKKRLSKKEKLKLNIVEEQKLTAFQQKYVEGAQLVLEFLEFTNFRYRVPSDSILEFDNVEKCFLISWVVIHNQKDINKFAKKKKLTDINEAVFLNDCPTPLFSTMTMTLSDLPKRFNPIILNSIQPVEHVQKRMERILEVGTRLSGYNLWYQLDGYDDSAMAENLRIELNDFEHSLRGKRQKKLNN